MFSTILFVAVAVFFSIVLFLPTYSSAKKNGNIIMGLSLPVDAFNDPGLKEFEKKTRDRLSATAIFFFILAAPLIFIGRYYSLSIAYLTIWFVAYLLVNNANVKQSIATLYLMKINKGWTTGNSSRITLDSVVSGMKSQFPIKKTRFLIPLIISAIPLVIVLFNKGNAADAFFFCAIGIIALLVTFIAYIFTCKTRAYAFSKNTDINVALNRSRIYEWSKAFVFAAIANSVAILGLYIVQSFELPLPLVLPILALALLVTLTYIFFTCGSSVRNQKNTILEHDLKQVYIDDDIYWLSGNYSNPNDKKIVVDKRIGFGTTINMASVGGKIIKVFLLMVAIAILVASVFLLPIDFGEVDVSFTPSTVSILAPYNEFSIDTDAIQSIDYAEEIHIGSKISGIDSTVFYIGEFNINPYGQCTTTVYRDVSECIILTTIDGQIYIVNSKTSDETMELYQKLLAN